MKITVNTSGPLFRGDTARDIRAALPEISEAIADDALRYMTAAPARRLQHAPFMKPTGHYRSQLQKRREGLNHVVHDSDVIYGDWLAGTSGRNAASRFKGYSHWRRAIQYVQSVKLKIARQVLDRRLG